MIDNPRRSRNPSPKLLTMDQSIPTGSGIVRGNSNLMEPTIRRECTDNVCTQHDTSEAEARNFHRSLGLS